MERLSRDPSVERTSESDGQYKVYPSRWVALALFCTLEMANALLWVSFAPISDISGHYFGQDNFYSSVTAVNMLANVFLIMYPVGTIAAVYTVRHYKARKALLFAGALTVVGALIRYIAAYSRDSIGPANTYALFVLGQALGAIAQPYFTNFAPALSGIWFAVDEREVSTSVGAMCSPLGNAIGQLIPPFLVSESDQPSADGTYEVQGMATLMLVEFLMCLVPLAFAYFFLQDAPPTPPSHSTKLKQLESFPPTDSVRPTEEFEPLFRPLEGGVESSTAQADAPSAVASTNDLVWRDIRALLSNRDFILLAISFCIGVGFFNSIMTLLNQIVGPSGYSNDDAGTFGAVFIVCGLIGAGIMGKVMETTKAYIPALRTGIVLAGLSNLLCFSLLYRNNFWPLLLSFAFMGACVLPLLPAMLENCAECTYPIPEELSAGILYTGSNLSALGFIFALQVLLGEDRLGPPPFLPSTLFVFGILVLAGVFILMYHGEYKRLKHEISHQQEQAARGGKRSRDYVPPPTESNLGGDHLHLVRVSSNEANSVTGSTARISSVTGTSSNIWQSNSRGQPPSPSQSGTFQPQHHRGGTIIGNPIQQLVAATASSQARADER